MRTCKFVSAVAWWTANNLIQLLHKNLDLAWLQKQVEVETSRDASWFGRLNSTSPHDCKQPWCRAPIARARWLASMCCSLAAGPMVFRAPHCNESPLLYLICKVQASLRPWKRSLHALQGIKQIASCAHGPPGAEKGYTRNSTTRWVL